MKGAEKALSNEASKLSSCILLFSPEMLGASANPFIDENQAARHVGTIQVDSARFFSFSL
jgi:hypothetical protein